jgi:hypothetical protein
MEGMMNKWQIGPVKLASGEEARIDAINEGQEDWRYIGRVQYLPGLWIACGWHASGRLMHASTCNPTMYAETNHECNLAPPPKKTVRVQAWLMVWPTGAVTVFYREEEAVFNTKKHGFALIPIDITVTEGDGLS